MFTTTTAAKPRPQSDGRGGDEATPDSSERGGARPTFRRGPALSTKAVVGGLLVAVSAVGLFVAAKSSGEEPVDTWIVARRSVPTGAVITKDDLALASGRLPAQIDAGLFAQPADLIGRVALTPISKHQLIGASSVGDAVSVDGRARRVSVELPTASALGGAISTGQPVDVVAIGSGEDEAKIVAPGAVVVGIAYPTGTRLDSNKDQAPATFGERLIVTFVVDSAETATKVLTATQQGGISLIAPTEMG